MRKTTKVIRVPDVEIFKGKGGEIRIVAKKDKIIAPSIDKLYQKLGKMRSR